LDEPLIWVRALHFAATMSVTGAVIFQAFVAEPAFHKDSRHEEVSTFVRSKVAWLTWFCLAVALLSGAAWLFLQAAQIGEMSWTSALSQGVVWAVLMDTDFGHDWALRLVLATLLAAALLGVRPERKSYPLMTTAVCLLSVGFVGTLAWAGHAAASPGAVGVIHLFSDFLHLVSAAAWVGALVPLAILLGTAQRRATTPSATIACDGLLRFSALGVLSVGALLVTGAINSWVLVGSVPALVDTDYGRLLLMKISLFFVMLSFAGVNRLRLTPTVVERVDAAASWDALRKIRRNSLIETAVGALVVIIVGRLGTMPPGQQW
jgi:copper resistance protein D